jgi:hypothetical protein
MAIVISVDVRTLLKDLGAIDFDRANNSIDSGVTIDRRLKICVD